MLNIVREQQPVKMQNIAEALAEYPLATLKKDLQYLVRENALMRIGRNRGTVYRVSNISQ